MTARSNEHMVKKNTLKNVNFIKITDLYPPESCKYINKDKYICIYIYIYIYILIYIILNIGTLLSCHEDIQ